MRHALALLAAATLALSAAAAQPLPQAPPDPDGGSGWVTVGLGAGSPHGTAGAASVNIGRERFVQVGYEGTANIGAQSLAFGVGRHASALHVGVGLSHATPRERTAVALGPAVAWGVRDNRGTEGSAYVTAGLVVNGQLLVAVSPEVGVGVVGFVNLNPVETVGGVALSLAIGSFR